MSGQPNSRIVVVDDDQPMRKLLQRQLADSGYDVKTFADGRAAMQGICEMGSGIVIADWSMPEMDGLELCRALNELHEMQALGNIYFILLTAHRGKDKVVEGLNAGAHDYLTKPYHQGELLARVHVGERMLRLQEELLSRNIEVQKVNAQMAILAAKLEHQANTDALTDLPNRRSLLEQFEIAWQASERDHHPLCCIMLDIDHFKRVNDTHGHAAGDQVLIGVANIVRRHARRPDLCGRFGGEEFMLVCPATHRKDAVALAERLRKDVSSCPIHAASQDIKVSVSCGVVERGTDTESLDELVSNADTMLYAAKESGRDQTWVSGPNRTWYPASDAASGVFAAFPEASEGGLAS